MVVDCPEMAYDLNSSFPTLGRAPISVATIDYSGDASIGHRSGETAGFSSWFGTTVSSYRRSDTIRCAASNEQGYPSGDDQPGTDA